MQTSSGGREVAISRPCLTAVPHRYGVVRAFWRHFAPRPEDGVALRRADDGPSGGSRAVDGGRAHVPSQRQARPSGGSVARGPARQSRRAHEHGHAAFVVSDRASRTSRSERAPRPRRSMRRGSRCSTAGSRWRDMWTAAVDALRDTALQQLLRALRARRRVVRAGSSRRWADQSTRAFAMRFGCSRKAPARG